MKEVAVLMMLKNEEKSIGISLGSIKKYFDVLIVYDTGSTDKTISIIDKFCKNNKIQLHLKQSVFKSFPESRNEALDFADTIDTKYLLLMDAGDEFTSNLSKQELLNIIKNIDETVDYGLVKQQWSTTTGLDDHNDIRFLRNKRNLRYDIIYPVHEQISNIHQYKSINLAKYFLLYQDRITYGESSVNRFEKDIELLLKAIPNKRNLYFLAQSYMSLDDYKNGFKYNVLCLNEKSNDYDVDIFTYVRAGYCAMMCKMNENIVMKYLKKAISFPNPPIDAYIYILRFYLDNKQTEKAIPYLRDLATLKKPNEMESTLVNHYFYDYVRWHLISVITLFAQQELELGKFACSEAIKNQRKPIDINNYRFFDS
jgi:glycosyltransferase involved in cell wall biosynthesis